MTQVTDVKLDTLMTLESEITQQSTNIITSLGLNVNTNSLKRRST